MSLVTLNGATQYLYEAASIGFEAIEEERDEEVETFDTFTSVDDLEQACASDDTQYLRDPEINPKKCKQSNAKLEESLQKASAEIVVETTRQEYNRYATGFKYRYFGLANSLFFYSAFGTNGSNSA